jgi:hypothetical protein
MIHHHLIVQACTANNKYNMWSSKTTSSTRTRIIPDVTLNYVPKGVHGILQLFKKPTVYSSDPMREPLPSKTDYIQNPPTPSLPILSLSLNSSTFHRSEEEIITIRDWYWYWYRDLPPKRTPHRQNKQGGEPALCSLSPHSPQMRQHSTAQVPPPAPNELLYGGSQLTVTVMHVTQQNNRGAYRIHILLLSHTHHFLCEEKELKNNAANEPVGNPPPPLPQCHHNHNPNGDNR